MPKLYELTGQLKELERLVSENQAPLSEVEDTIKLIEGDFEEKAINIVKVIRNKEPDISAIDEEIKRLQQMKKNINAKAENLKEYLRQNMEANGINKIECPIFSITLKRAAASVKIIDENLLPDEYVTIKTSCQPDKASILKALKNGEQIKGAELASAKPALEIK